MVHPATTTRIVTTAIWLSLIILHASPAWGWNDTGHMTGAYIAYRDLKPEVRQRVAQLLREHPRYQQDLLRDMSPGFADPNLYAFMRAATWPDMVRDLGNPMHASHDHPTWHYINFPLVAPADMDRLHPPAPDLEARDVDNILKALTKAHADLRSADVSAPDKAIALCWLSHLVGDLHQPLHTTSLYCDMYPQGDKGGNLFLVRNGAGEVVNLHFLWDGILGPQSTHRAVRLIAENILSNPGFQRTAFGEELSQRGFKAWADESCADSREIVYNNFKLRGAAPDPAPPVRDTQELLASRPATRPTNSSDRKPQSSTAPALPVSYEAVARELASRRIALAGYRLADDLNELLAKSR